MNSHDNSVDPAQRFPRLAVFRGEADDASEQTVRLDEQLSEMESEIRSLAPARVDVQIGGLFERAFPRIALPATQVEGLIRHLVIDAMDAMPAGGTLSIFIEHVTSGVAYPLSHPELAPGNYVMLSVCDTGGKAPDDDEDGDAPFTVSSASSLLDKGRALGLSAAFEAIQFAGGDFSVSHRRQVTAVRIYFPVADEG